MIGIVTYLFLSILIGSIICLFGYKLYFPFLMGIAFLATFTFSIQWLGVNLQGTILAVLCGGIAAGLTVFFYKLSVFLIGAFGGGALGFLISAFLPAYASHYCFLIIILFSLEAGILATKWCNLFIILSTAFSGGVIISYPLCFFILEFNNLKNFAYADGITSTMLHLNEYLTNSFATQQAMLLLIATSVITVIGFFYQNSKRRLQMEKFPLNCKCFLQ